MVRRYTILRYFVDLFDSTNSFEADTHLVRQLRARGRIVEPLQDFHKDEVRELGHQLGLPDALIWRQPFPGPGLAIRIICAEDPFIPPDARNAKLRLATFAAENKIGVHLLPCRTVGVQGDGRSYSSVVALAGRRDWSLLLQLARSIPKEVHSVNRVVYVFGQDADTNVPFTITKTLLRKEEIEQLQKADDIVNQELQRHNLVRSLSQVPVILFVSIIFV